MFRQFVFSSPLSSSGVSRSVGFRSVRAIKQGSSGIVFALATVLVVGAQDMSKLPIDPKDPRSAALVNAAGNRPPGQKRDVTLDESISIFLQQNLQLIAAKYDVNTAEAEKLSARVRPNPC